MGLLDGNIKTEGAWIEGDNEEEIEEVQLDSETEDQIVKIELLEPEWKNKFYLRATICEISFHLQNFSFEIQKISENTKKFSTKLQNFE